MVRIPPGFKEEHFPAGKVSIHYLEGPRKGPALILLHGMARDWHSFSVLIPDLSARYHVFLVDLRGHGASGRIAGGYRVPQFSADISAFVHKIAPRGVAIFGHSLGAMVGMHVAASGQCKVNALIVGDSMISPENLAASPYHTLFSQLRELILRGGPQQELALGMGRIQIRLPGFEEMFRLEELAGNTPSVLSEWARSAALTDPDVLAMSLDGSAFEGWDPQTLLPQISCPVLLLQANPEMDALLSDADVKMAKQLIPRAEHVRFALLGHALFMQQPRPVLTEVLRFLEAIQR